MKIVAIIYPFCFTDDNKRLHIDNFTSTPFKDAVIEPSKNTKGKYDVLWKDQPDCVGGSCPIKQKEVNMRKFGKRLSVDVKKMDIDKAKDIATQNINEMQSFYRHFKQLQVNYWYDLPTKRFIVAYTVDIEWRWWYIAWLNIIGFFINKWFGVKRTVRKWRRN